MEVLGVGILLWILFVSALGFLIKWLIEREALPAKRKIEMYTFLIGALNEKSPQSLAELKTAGELQWRSDWVPCEKAYTLALDHLEAYKWVTVFYIEDSYRRSFAHYRITELGAESRFDIVSALRGNPVTKDLEE